MMKVGGLLDSQGNHMKKSIMVGIIMAIGLLLQGSYSRHGEGSDFADIVDVLHFSSY